MDPLTLNSQVVTCYRFPIIIIALGLSLTLSFTYYDVEYELLSCTAASMARHQSICRPICSASPTSVHGSDFALRRRRHWLAVARSVRQSATVLLPLPHRPSGTACRKTYGHPQRCSCSDVGWSLIFSGVLWPKTLHVTLFLVTWPCSFATLRHVNWTSFIIIIIIIIIINPKTEPNSNNELGAISIHRDQ